VNRKKIVNKNMTMVVQKNIDLSKYTTLKTGGKAKYFFEVTTVEELKTAVLFAKQNELPFFVLGGGSNLLALDEGYVGVIIKISLSGIVFGEETEGKVTVSVSAGEILDEFIILIVSHGLWGLENLSHIPGTVGATPVQNVGAYGVEVSDFIKEVTVFDVDTFESLILSVDECNFGYRDSIFKTDQGKKYIITAVSFNLTTTPHPRLKYADLTTYFNNNKNPILSEIREAIINIRSQKFPDWHLVGTAGSFFKNPIVKRTEIEFLLQEYPSLPIYDAGENMVKLSLGFILDKICGLKGYQDNRVRLYEKQALVLVAESGSTSTEIENFSSMIAKKVFKKTNLNIELEITKIK